jgi:hypothetical protein
MAEQQLEIETTEGCKRCGEELPDFHLGENCTSCQNKIDKAENDFSMTQEVISKLIYGKVSKADLHIFYKIIIYVADQEAFASFEINQSHFAKEHNLQQANISRSIKKLVKAKLLIKNENLYSFGMSKIT